MVNDEIICIDTIDVKPHLSMSLALTILPTGELALFSGGTDLKFTLFLSDSKTACTFKKILSLDGHSDWIRSINIAKYTGSSSSSGMSPGDLMIATASQDKYIRIWKVGPQDKNLLSDTIDILGEDTLISTKSHVFGKANYTVMLNAISLGHDDWVFSINWNPVILNGVCST